MSTRHSAISIAHAFQELYNLSSALTSHLTPASGGQWSGQTTLGTGGGGGGEGRMDGAAVHPPMAAASPMAAVVRCGN